MTREKDTRKTFALTSTSLILIVIVIVLLLVFVSYGLIYVSTKNNNSNKQSDDVTGEDFSFTLVDGSTKKLSDYRGKIVIMDLWATWCGPCQLQMIDFIDVYEEYSRAELEILSINIESSDSLQDIQNFIDAFSDYGYDLNWVFGNDDGSIWQKYMIQGYIPTLYIFDQNGEVHYNHESRLSYESLKTEINKLL